MTSEFIITSAVLTHPGRKRAHNEDFVAFFEPDQQDELQQSGRLYIVADGVGGEARGEKASQYAAQKVLYDFYNDDNTDLGARLKRALRQAGNDIYDHIERSGSFTRMATTMVAAVVWNGTLTVANVGDSRAYLIRSGQTSQITRDHTIAGELIRNGEINEADAMRVKGKHQLTRSLGGERNVHVDVFPNIALQSGDRILLCTDGLARYTLSEDITRLATEGDPEEAVHNCVDYANRQGGADNITIALIEVGEPAIHAVPTIQRGKVPAPVDWDSMVTMPSIRPVRSRRLRLTPRQRTVLGAITLGIVVTLVLGSAFFQRTEDGLTGLEAGKETLSKSETSEPIVVERTLTVEVLSSPTVDILSTGSPIMTIFDVTSCLTEPSEGAEILKDLHAEQRAPLVERDEVGAWLKIELSEGDFACWVRSSDGRIQGDIENLPIITPTDIAEAATLEDQGLLCVYSVNSGDNLTAIIERIFPHLSATERALYITWVVGVLEDGAVVSLDDRDKLIPGQKLGFGFVTADQCDDVTGDIVDR